jgi:hypothetical protein
VASCPHSLIPGGPTRAWRSLNRTCEKEPQAPEGDECAWGCRGGGREPRPRKTIRGVWTHRPLDLALRAARRTPNGTVVGGLCDPNSAFSAAVSPKLREAVCPRNSPRKTQHSTAARAGRLKEGMVANLPHGFSHRQHASTLKSFGDRVPLGGDCFAATQWTPTVRRDRRWRPFGCEVPLVRSRVGL